MKNIIFAYWLIYEQFYKRRKGYKTDFFKSWHNGFKRLKKYPAWFNEARKIHESQKADK